jgi:hypothetical protein
MHDEFIGENTENIRHIFIFLFIVINIGGFSRYIGSQWSYFRCHPFILPFSGSENNTHCLKKVSDEVVKNNGKEQALQTNIIGGSIFNLKSDILSHVKSLGKLTGSHSSAVSSITNKINNLKATLMFMVEKMKVIVKKLLAIFTVIIYAMYSSIVFMQGMIAGPIGAAATILDSGSACFSGDTLINGTPMKDIPIGGDILSLMEFYYPENYIYDYKGVKVTGDHLVFENKWIPVKDSDISRKIPFYENKVYCLITKSNTIEINNSLFSDFIGVSGDISNTIRTKIINKLNNGGYSSYGDESYGDESEYYESGILNTTRIGTKPIKDIKLGDTLPDNSVVTGIVKQLNDKWVSINNTYTTRGQIVYYNGKFIKAVYHPLAKEYSFTGECISINTNNGIYKVNNLEFLQYNEIHCDNTENYILNVMNKNITV